LRLRSLPPVPVAAPGHHHGAHLPRPLGRPAAEPSSVSGCRDEHHALPSIPARGSCDTELAKRLVFRWSCIALRCIRAKAGVADHAEEALAIQLVAVLAAKAISASPSSVHDRRSKNAVAVSARDRAHLHIADLVPLPICSAASITSARWPLLFERELAGRFDQLEPVFFNSLQDERITSAPRGAPCLRAHPAPAPPARPAGRALPCRRTAARATAGRQRGAIATHIAIQPPASPAKQQAAAEDLRDGRLLTVRRILLPTEF
jgi:hypothetical protein